jgi:hypothetical protein
MANPIQYDAAAILLAVGIGVALVCGSPRASAGPPDYTFDGTIARPVLDHYLSRAITMLDLLTGAGNVEDNLRMLEHIGAKFAGRTLYRWGGESRLETILPAARTIAAKIHTLDSEMILQAGIFEIVTTDVNKVSVPEWVFTEFGLPPEKRTFRYEAMLSPVGLMVDHWSKNASVPDITRLETRLWFYYLAANYIDLGCEAIHFGQVALIGATDWKWKCWWDLLTRVRRYAHVHARRHLVLCDAHTPDGGPGFDGDKLLFDFHAFPLRIDEVPDRPPEGVLRMGYLDSIFGRSSGGLAPSGWRCEHLPYLVELDNWGASGKEGQKISGCWIWGYDEICWFARQSETYRNDWLRYAWKWIREHDPNGFLEMPGSRCLAVPVERPGGEKISWYFANRRSDTVPNGFNQEDTIRAIWAGD